MACGLHDGAGAPVVVFVGITFAFSGILPSRLPFPLALPSAGFTGPFVVVLRIRVSALVTSRFVSVVVVVAVLRFTPALDSVCRLLPSSFGDMGCAAEVGRLLFCLIEADLLSARLAAREGGKADIVHSSHVLQR